MGEFWAIDFEGYGCYKSPLMGWTSATHDTHANVYMRFGKLQDAVNYAMSMGWGYDIMMPNSQRWHTKKNYADNFAWKGFAEKPEKYD